MQDQQDIPVATVDAATAATAAIAGARESLRGLAARSGAVVPAAELGAAILGDWPDAPSDPAAGVGALAQLVAERDPSHPALLAGLLAAEPSLVAQLTSLARLTSLTRVLDGVVPDEDPAAWTERLGDLVSGDAEGPGACLDDLRQRIAEEAAALLAGRDLDAASANWLGRTAELEARAGLARCRVSRDRLTAGGGDCQLLRQRLARCAAAAGDFERLAGRLQAGEDLELRASRSRFAAVIGREAMAALVAATGANAGARRLERLLIQIAEPYLRVEDPAAALRRLQDLVRVQGDRPLLAADPDPLLLGVFALERGRGCWLQLEVPADRLATAVRQGFEPPAGVVVVGEALLVACTPEGAELPEPPARARASDEDVRELEGQTAMKQLVLNNIGTTSVLLEFLRDAKITSIPGLVEEIVVRTRNPQVLEVVATTRSLVTGFANRNVPHALLKSPVNVSIRTLRRFIHVKYVSKVELRRMAADKSGLRKEVHREIVKYLKTLV